MGFFFRNGGSIVFCPWEMQINTKQSKIDSLITNVRFLPQAYIKLFNT